MVMPNGSTKKVEKVIAHMLQRNSRTQNVLAGEGDRSVCDCVGDHTLSLVYESRTVQG